MVFLSASCLFGQEAFLDEKTRNTLDSLDQRIQTLQRELPRLAETRAPSWFFKKRDLDYSLFLKAYTQYLFDEELDEAQRLIESRLKGATKRNDNDAIEFYTAYRQKIAREIGNQQARYQKLFAKEKNFRKELYRFINQGDEYSLHRAVRMTELAMNYAEERNLTSVLEYLPSYHALAEASLFDYNTAYDLNKLTHSEAAFFKTFNPMVESDSLELIKQAGELVRNCHRFAESSKSVLDTKFFEMQEKVVMTSLSDYYQRQGNNSNLSTLGGQSVIARLDSLNREGVYKWRDKIVVVGHFKPDASFQNVKKGEAIMEADQKLIEYIRVNRLAKLRKEVEIGSTALIPYQNSTDNNEFLYNPQVKKYQYMVCYSKIESQYFTRQISKFLPPLQFDVETQSP